MAEKLVMLIAGANGIWTGTRRVEPGEVFEVPEAQAQHLLAKGAAFPAPSPAAAEPPKGGRGKKEARKGAE